MTKKVRKAKKGTLRFLVFGVACISISATLLVSIAQVWVQIFNKYKEKETLNKELIELKKDEQKLTIDVEKLQDPEYIARYLREKYLYSKSNEYIIKIPSDEKN